MAAWRTYQQFWQHQKLSKYHFFPGLVTGVGEHYMALCGKVAQGDYIRPQEPRPEMRERFYCKRCRTLHAIVAKGGNTGMNQITRQTDFGVDWLVKVPFERIATLTTYLENYAEPNAWRMGNVAGLDYDSVWATDEALAAAIAAYEGD